MNDLLQLEAVSKSFGGVSAVRAFSLKVGEGEALGIIGPNGAGKTTLFNLISGITKVDSGRVMFAGCDVTRLKPYERTTRGMSRTFQLARPFSRMTVAENVLVGRVFRGQRPGKKEPAEEVHNLLGEVALLEKAEQPAETLTLAEQRRLELARALATIPKLLMLDEVMAGLTPAERFAMIERVRRVSEERGLALIVSEHVMDAVARLCSRLVVMYQGRILIEGETDSVLRSEKVAEVYLGPEAARVQARV